MSSIYLALLLSTFSAHAKPLQTYKIHIEQTPARIYSLDVRVGVQEPDGDAIGDILYLTGFGDRLDNHGPLFADWVAAGFRVISFDYPSHGETSGTPINLFTFKRLAQLATQVEQETRQNVNRPLILSGWSTGGLLSVRMVQSSRFPHFAERPIAGMILFAPGIAANYIVGTPTITHWFGEVTNATLTHNPNPPHMGPAQPISPITFSSFLFAGFLKFNSYLSQYEKYPNLPTVIFAADDYNDLYVSNQYLKNWIAMQDEENEASIILVTEPGARHEIDNESATYGGPQARRLAADFAKSVVLKIPFLPLAQSIN